jgi:hypothetical protein
VRVAHSVSPKNKFLSMNLLTTAALNGCPFMKWDGLFMERECQISLSSGIVLWHPLIQIGNQGYIYGEGMPTLSSGVVLWHPLIQIGNLAAFRGVPIAAFKEM